MYNLHCTCPRLHIQCRFCPPGDLGLLLHPSPAAPLPAALCLKPPPLPTPLACAPFTCPPLLQPPLPASPLPAPLSPATLLTCTPFTCPPLPCSSSYLQPLEDALLLCVPERALRHSPGPGLEQRNRLFRAQPLQLRGVQQRQPRRTCNRKRQEAASGADRAASFSASVSVSDSTTPTLEGA